MIWLIDLLQSLADGLQALPVLLLLLLTLPFVLLAWSRRIFPNTPLVLLVLAPCALTLVLLARRDVLPVVVAVDVALALAATADLFSLPKATAFSVERVCQRIASLKQNHAVLLTVTNLSQRDQVVWVRDGIPQEFEPTPEQFALRMAPRTRSVLHYELKPSRRGAFQLDSVHIRACSRLGLWQIYCRYPAESTIHVYPDMKQLSEYAILARTNRLSLMGVRTTRRIGQDNEFERLRDYALDDNYKHIDWRSTARRNKLTVKDYQSSQSQRLIFLIDCGRMMTNQSAGLSLLDHSLNAMLMLAFLALRKGDSVGMISFSDQIHSCLPPRGGMSQMNHLLHAAFDRFPRLVESRYDLAFLRLSSQCRKRSLVILITNVIDEVNSTQIEKYLSTLVGRHLPLGVLLRDQQLFEAVDVLEPRGEQIFRAAAAAEIIMWRHQVLRDMSHNGVLAVDVSPQDLTAHLLNRYLEIKARHLL